MGSVSTAPPAGDSGPANSGSQASPAPPDAGVTEGLSLAPEGKSIALRPDPDPQVPIALKLTSAARVTGSLDGGWWRIDVDSISRDEVSKTAELQRVRDSGAPYLFAPAADMRSVTPGVSRHP